MISRQTVKNMLVSRLITNGRQPSPTQNPPNQAGFLGLPEISRGKWLNGILGQWCLGDKTIKLSNQITYAISENGWQAGLGNQ